MSIYESPSSPKALAHYLLTYISDESAIIGHVKHRFGVQLDDKDLARIKRDMPRKYIQGQGKPGPKESAFETGLGDPFRPRRIKRADPLLKALAAYHYKRAKTPEEQKHWRGLM